MMTTAMIGLEGSAACREEGTIGNALLSPTCYPSIKTSLKKVIYKVVN
jgi:hypothetical protein